MVDDIFEWLFDRNGCVFLVMIGAVLMFGVLIIGSVLDARMTQDCLRHGYPNVASNWNYTEWYCVKRKDQTDVVVPFAEATR